MLIGGYKRGGRFSLGFSAFLGLFSFFYPSVITPTLQHLGVREDFNLVREGVREGDSRGHPAFFLAIYEIPAFDSLPNPMVNRALVEPHFLREGSERHLSNTPVSNTGPNSGDRLPDGGGNRGLDAIREQLLDQHPDGRIIGHGGNDAPLVVAVSGRPVQERVRAYQRQQQLEVSPQPHGDRRMRPASVGANGIVTRRSPVASQTCMACHGA